MDNKNYGVITEQGFVAGNGLGFQPVKESDLNPNKKDEDVFKNKDNTQKTKESK